jgi:hypothetical protein
VISFAGLWDEWKDRAAGKTLKSCTKIIIEPNALGAAVLYESDLPPPATQKGGVLDIRPVSLL